MFYQDEIRFKQVFLSFLIDSQPGYNNDFLDMFDPAMLPSKYE